MTGSEKTVLGELQRLAGLGPAAGFILPRRQMVGVWDEEVILCYCVGEGTFSDDVKTINLMMDVYDFNDNWIGHQQGVHLSLTPLDVLLSTPPAPPPPFDQPSEVPTKEVQEWTKGIWTFADGSAVYAVGPAQSHLVPFQDGSFVFTVTTGQVLAGGTGRYDGCAGIKSATGSAFVPAGLIQSGKFPAPGFKFKARTVENFRIARPGTWKPVGPAPGRRAPAGGAEEAAEASEETSGGERSATRHRPGGRRS